MTNRPFLLAPLRCKTKLPLTRSSSISIQSVFTSRYQNAARTLHHHARPRTWKAADLIINLHGRASPALQIARSKLAKVTPSSQTAVQTIHRRQIRRYSYTVSGPFTPSTPLFKNKAMPPRPKPPPDEEIDESFLKGSGPGGQKINKTNSAVQLKHLPTGVVVKCQATRSRSQNRTIARQLLADKLDDMVNGDKARSAIVANSKAKKRASSAKKSRRKYRNLEDGEEADEEAVQAEDKETQAGKEQGKDDQEANNLRPPSRPKAKANIVEIRK